MAVDFFKKHAWPTGEHRWHFHILFDNQKGVQDMAKAYGKQLDHTGLYPPIPTKWLHMTIMMLGPTSQIKRAEIERIVRIIRPQCKALQFPELEVGPCWVWSGSVCAHITPEQPVKQLFEIVSQAAYEVLGNRLIKPSVFIPHITLAYPQDTTKENEIRKRLTERWIEPVTFQPTHLSLVEQQQKPSFYTWKEITKIQIGV